MPRNWEEHYSKPANLDFTPAPLLVEASEMLRPGRALDLACGAGRNSLFLAGLGWRVTAVDSSATAIRLLRERFLGLAIEAKHADLEKGEFRIAPDAYDLICDFFYLQRNLFPQIRDGVRPGGVFAAAIHVVDDAPDSPARTADFQLQPGELRNEFAGWKILYYSEALERGRLTARLLARKA